MTGTEGTSPGSKPGVKVPEVTLQRGASGRWSLTEVSGAWIEADASVFVEIEN